MTRAIDQQLNAVDFNNNGCGCRLTDVPYLKRDVRGWQLGVTVCEFDDDTVIFRADGNRLTARHAGKRYSVPLDTSMPDDFA